MEPYADITFYKEVFLNGKEPKIPDGVFPYWSMIATGTIRKHTFSRTDTLEVLPYDVKMCCCEIAEKLYQCDLIKGDTGMVLQSFSNDGDSGTYYTADMSHDAMNSSIAEMLERWLLSTGLLYCGVDE